VVGPREAVHTAVERLLVNPVVEEGRVELEGSGL